MSELKEMFKNSKPKPGIIQLGEYRGVEYPKEYKMPKSAKNLPQLFRQNTQENSVHNSIFQSSQILQKKSTHDKPIIQTIFINTQTSYPTQVISTQNYDDYNYDDFYDDDWMESNDSKDDSNFNNTTFDTAVNNISEGYNCINDTMECNNNVLTCNTSDSTLSYDGDDSDQIDEKEYEDDIYDEIKTFLKSDKIEFINEHELLPDEKLQKINKILNEVFGHICFIYEQKEAITAALLGHDIFILMPSGTGKSLCYQLPAIIDSGITIVVCPFETLIENEISMLTKLGIPAQSLSSNINNNKYSDFYRKIITKEESIKLLYITPEIVNGSENFQNFLLILHEKGMLSRFVINDAHCISKFSHNFRPHCSALSCLRKNFQNSKIPIILLTSTATPKVILDIKCLFKIESSKMFISTFERPNIKYDVIHRTSKSQITLINKVKSMFPKGCGIFYCFSKKECELLHDNLKSYDITSIVYHGGMSDRKKREIENKWMSNEVQVICSTVAFGPGINKPDVRFVIHLCMPMSIENYYEESGLAGRDGLPSYCVILYGYVDSIRQKRLIIDNFSLKKIPNRENIEIYKVNQMLSYCESISECRRKILLEYFGEMYDCDKCLKNSKTICNNCELSINPIPLYKLYDLTLEAEYILQTTIDIQLTMKQMSDCYRGRINKKRSNSSTLQSTKIYGRGSSLSEDDANRLIIRLIIDGYLKEDIKIIEGSNYTSIAGYLLLTSKGQNFLSSSQKQKIFLYTSLKNGQRRKTRNYDLIPDNVSVTSNF